MFGFFKIIRDINDLERFLQHQGMSKGAANGCGNMLQKIYQEYTGIARVNTLIDQFKIDFVKETQNWSSDEIRDPYADRVDMILRQSARKLVTK